MTELCEIIPEKAKLVSGNSEVLSAVVSAMAAIKKIEKNNKNLFDKYDFASIDDFLQLVNPICAEHGLITHMQEAGIVDFNKKTSKGDSSWMRITFDITLFHKSGQTMPPVTRSVEVMRSGAQAFGSAQSYVLKQYLRGLFLIPTGDKDDADFEPRSEGTVEPYAPQYTPERSATYQKNGASKNETTRALFTELKQEVEACGTDLDALQILSDSDEFRSKIKMLPHDWQDEIKRLGAEAKAEAFNHATGENQ